MKKLFFVSIENRIRIRYYHDNECKVASWNDKKNDYLLPNYAQVMHALRILS